VRNLQTARPLPGLGVGWATRSRTEQFDLTNLPNKAGRCFPRLACLGAGSASCEHQANCSVPTAHLFSSIFADTSYLRRFLHLGIGYFPAQS
jgi:hypothetical protein